MPEYPDGTIIHQGEWYRLLQTIPSSYTIWQDGVTYRAECNISGGTDYGPEPDFPTLVEEVSNALPSGATIFYRKGDYTSNSTIDLLTSHQTHIFEAGFKLTHSGTAEAFKIGSDTMAPTNVRLIGNWAQITRATLGGTYGIHSEFAHLSEIDGFYIKNFATAPIYLEGSWGTQLRRIEVDYAYAGTYGLAMDDKLLGADNQENNLVTIEDCWLTGTTACVDMTGAGPCDVTFKGCDFHQDTTPPGAGTTIGIRAHAGHNLTVKNCYFEALHNYSIQLQGDIVSMGNIDIHNNWFWIPTGHTGIYVQAAALVNIYGNSVEVGGAGTKFIDTPADATNRFIYVGPNRMGSPANTTEYDGNAESLMYYLQHTTAAGAAGGLEKLTISNDLILNNAIYLQCKNAAGTPQDVLGIAGDNNLHVYNPAGHVYINPKAGSQTIIGIDNAGEIWLGYHTGGGVLPANILLDPNAATGTIHLNGPTVHIPSADVDIQTGYLHVQSYVNTTDVYKVAATQVVGARGAAVADAAGGATVDAEARTAINTLMARLRTHGLISP